MIVLNQGENIAYFTLSDSVTLTSSTPYFLFRFISETTKEEILFTSENISSSTTKYDEFVITLSGTSNLTGGTITMDPPGFWKYFVYQQYDQYNLSLTGVSGSYIDSGFVKLIDGPVSMIQNEWTGGTYTNTYYDIY